VINISDYLDSNRDKEFNRKNSKSFDKLANSNSNNNDIDSEGMLIVDNKAIQKNPSTLESLNEDMNENINTLQSEREASHKKAYLIDSAGPKSGSRSSSFRKNEFGSEE
jgi:hypothetical protein